MSITPRGSLVAADSDGVDARSLTRKLAQFGNFPSCVNQATVADIWTAMWLVVSLEFVSLMPLVALPPRLEKRFVDGVIPEGCLVS